ncbi:MAG: type I pantothenate kinase [Acidobacteria bacterium]|nr:type I pantothenate kinase [Acidobacteriota bacterium]
MTATATAPLSRFLTFERDDWARLRDNTPLTLSEADLDSLRGLNEQLSLDEVVRIYLPLSRLLNLHVRAVQALYRAQQTFLGNHTDKVPFIIGLAGSVAVGKSTTARVLQALLARWPSHPSVALVTTDGFLFPNAVLEERGLMHRKGFPESYDRAALVRFLADVKAGYPEVQAPVYSHQRYDIVPGAAQLVRHPDVVIVEGLNVLQGPPVAQWEAQLFASDFFDYSIYVDADEAHIQSWYVERFLRLRDTVFQDPQSYFHRYAALSESEARQTAGEIWARINGVNLRENILPTRMRAHLILQKGADHHVERVQLRRV